MESHAGFWGILGAAALPQSENHIGQQQCCPFILRHTVFRKQGFSQINVTTHRRSASSTRASREPQLASIVGSKHSASNCTTTRLRSALLCLRLRLRLRLRFRNPVEATLAWRVHGTEDLAARRIDQAGDDTARKVNAEVVRAALIHDLSGTRSGLRSRAAKSLSRAVAPPISFNNGWTTGMNHARSTS
jgi:hypothetical protein